MTAPRRPRRLQTTNACAISDDLERPSKSINHLLRAFHIRRAAVDIKTSTELAHRAGTSATSE